MANAEFISDSPWAQVPLVELAQYMRPVSRKHDFAALDQLLIATITVDLKEVLELREVGCDAFGPAIRALDLNRRRWLGPIHGRLSRP